MDGHEDMLDYLADYCTQDKMYGRHYYPVGALCWFETNAYGEPTGSVYYIRKNPVYLLRDRHNSQTAFKRLKAFRNRTYEANEILARSGPGYEVIPTVKPKL